MSGTPSRSLADLKDMLAAQAKPAPPGPEPVLSDQPKREPQRDQFGRAYATGRRKNAVARVWIKPGKGEITVNDKKVVEYFARADQLRARSARHPEGGRLPHPRLPRGRAQEVRQDEGPTQLPVQQALT